MHRHVMNASNYEFFLRGVILDPGFRCAPSRLHSYRCPVAWMERSGIRDKF